MSTDQVDDPGDPRLILVDGNDAIVGHELRSKCHEGEGLLHRAFSIYILDSDGRLLLQQRSLKKILWSGWWSNSCCGHPVHGETIEVAATRRLGEELGFTVPLEYVFKFRYQARFGGGGSENELCSVFRGRLKSAIVRPDPDEVMDWQFVAPKVLEARFASENDLTPWFRMGWQRLAECS